MLLSSSISLDHTRSHTLAHSLPAAHVPLARVSHVRLLLCELVVYIMAQRKRGTSLPVRLSSGGWLTHQPTDRSVGAPAVMPVSVEEMQEERVPLALRDYCAHLLIPLNKCRLETFHLPWKCHHERHEYERCQYIEYAHCFSHYICLID